MPNMVNVTIDGVQVQVPAGSTILDAANAVGVYIPTLCHLDLHEAGMVNKPQNETVNKEENYKKADL